MASTSNGSNSTGKAQQLQLSADQEAIIQSVGNIRINAVAGSGKTTTLIHYAASRPAGSRLLYLAYNRSVRLEAQKKFAAHGLHNVQVETAHSLAYRAMVPRHGYKVRAQAYKTHEIAALLGLASTGEKHGEYILANHINRFITFFCNSSAQKVSELDYRSIVSGEKAQAFVHHFYAQIVHGARLLLAKMNRGEIEIIHDFYLKKYQLSNPVLPYDYILFDEGQDASPAMLHIFLAQQATKVIVGDAHQQIYAWRHAVNSLERVGFPSYALSTSFRFGTVVARLATAVLEWKKHLHEEATSPEVLGKGKASVSKTSATLGRTNLGLLVSAINYITAQPGVKHLYFEGNIHSYTYADDGASLYDVLNLHTNNPAGIRDPLVRSMKDMDELEDYIEKTEDVQLGMMVTVVKEYGSEIHSLIKRLKSLHVGDAEKEKAEMIFSTVHRAKGMEYDVVHLVADFITEARLQKWKEEEGDKADELEKQRLNEEINLLYVAVTRAKSALHIPEELLPNNFTPAAPIYVVKKEKEDKTAYVKGGREVNVMATDYKYHKALSNSGNDVYQQERLARKNGSHAWTEEADNALRNLFHRGVKLAQMAHHFHCKTGAIVARLKKLGCIGE
ncbi:MAG: 3'-5' exonuclease [Chitinophagaceae bacterium]